MARSSREGFHFGFRIFDFGLEELASFLYPKSQIQNPKSSSFPSRKLRAIAPSRSPGGQISSMEIP
jgi:hypothetical protein